MVLSIILGKSIGTICALNQIKKPKPPKWSNLRQLNIGKCNLIVGASQAVLASPGDLTNSHRTNIGIRGNLRGHKNGKTMINAHQVGRERHCHGVHPHRSGWGLGPLLLGLFICAGCPGSESPDIPLFPFEGPELPDQLLGTSSFEMREFIEEFENRNCENAVARNCRVLNAIRDTAQQPSMGMTPRMPDEFPRYIDIPADGPAGGYEEVDVDNWANEEKMPGIGPMSSIVPVDLSGLFEDFFPDEPISIESVSLDFLVNTLNFDVQEVVLLIDPEPLPDDRPPPPPHILEQQQRARPVGFFPGRAPLSTGRTDMTFVEGGQTRLSDAINEGRFTGVIKINQTQPRPLPEGAEPNRRRRPAGLGEVNLVVGISTLNEDEVNE